MKMNPVVHFEMPSEDGQRIADFYTNVFGWKTQTMGADMGNYIVVSTTEVSENHVPTESGRINGGFYPKSKDAPHPSVVIAVDDIKEHIKKITEAGGKVIGEPVEIPKVGIYVSFIDTEGNRASILQPSPMM